MTTGGSNLYIDANCLVGIVIQEMAPKCWHCKELHQYFYIHQFGLNANKQIHTLPMMMLLNIRGHLK